MTMAPYFVYLTQVRTKVNGTAVLTSQQSKSRVHVVDGKGCNNTVVPLFENT